MGTILAWLRSLEYTGLLVALLLLTAGGLFMYSIWGAWG